MLIKIFSTVAVILVVNIVFALISNSKDKLDENVVRLPKVYGIIGIVCLIVFLGIIIFYLLDNDQYSFAFLFEFSIFAAMCVYIVLGYLNWRIKYDDGDTFEYRTTFRHTLKIKYSDVIKTHSVRTGDLLIKVYKRWLVIDREAIGKDEFRDKLYIHIDTSKHSKKEKKQLRKPVKKTR